MAKYVYLYTGGKIPETPEAQQESMQAWMGWFGGLGTAVSDMGNQLGASATVSAGGVSDGGALRAGGYSVIVADSLEDATAKAAGCPIVASGGAVEVYATIEM